MSCCSGRISIGVLFVMTWLYIWLRALYVPLVHDEAATFFIYIQTGNYLPFFSYPDANNHILNSLLSSLSFKLLGSSSLALRLPNVLMWPVYFFSVYRISTRINNTLLRWMLLLSLVLAHNFVEFFALCRGYGMSMGFFMLSMLFLFRALEKRKNVDRIAALVAIVFALSANLTLIHTALIFCAIILISAMTGDESKKSKVRKLLLMSAISFIPIFTLLLWMIFLKDRGLLYYHSVEGFFAAVPGTLSLLLTGIEASFPAWILTGLALLALILGLFIILKNKTSLLAPGIITLLIFSGDLAAILLGHLAFRTHYPEDRTAMFLFPLIIITLAFLLDSTKFRVIKVLRYTVMLLLLFFPVHYLSSLNTNHSSLWYQEGVPGKFHQVVADKTKNSGRVPSIGGYMLRRFCWGYLNYRSNDKLPPVKTSGYPDFSTDYQIVHMNKDFPWLYYYNQIAYDLPSGLSLLERKKILPREEIDRMGQAIAQESVVSEEYYGFISKDITGSKAKRIFVDLSFEIQTDERPFQASVVGKIENSRGEEIAAESVEMNMLRYCWRGNDTGFHQGMLISGLPDDSLKLSVFMVNAEKKTFTIRDSEIKIFKVQE